MFKKTCFIAVIAFISLQKSIALEAVDTIEQTQTTQPQLIFTDVTILFENYAFDIKNGISWYADAAVRIEYCGNEHYFCLRKPFDFSVPKEITSTAQSWSIGNVEFSLIKTAKPSPCKDTAKQLYKVEAHNKKSDIIRSFLFSVDSGISLMNEYSPSNKKLMPKYAWINCSSELFSNDQMKIIESIGQK